MKSQNFTGLLIVLFLATIVTSCSKEKELQNIDENATSFQTKFLSNNNYQWDRANLLCPPDGHKCSKLSALPVQHKTIMEGVIRTIQSGNVNDIKNSFTNNKLTLTQYISTSWVNAVINGTSVPRVSYNATTKLYYIAFGADDCIYQLSIE